jgi:citronellol/citronellal dehydrogenase
MKPTDESKQLALCEALWAAPSIYRPDLFAGQVAIVSGGGSGLGRAIALLLARLGAKVAICGRTAEKLDRVAEFARNKGASLLTQLTDIRQPEQVAALFDRVTSEWGPPQIVVNNAGGQYPQDAIDFAPKGWSAVVNNNLNGTWYMMQRAAQGWH